MKKILFPILFPLFLNAQENFNNGTWISGNAHYGFIIPHNEVLLYLTQGHIYGGEINFYKITSGKKQWQKDYKNPEIGLNAYYIYLSNPAQLGFGASINPYINFPLARTKRFALKFKTAVSFGYISKTFDKVNNFKDYAIGSHINGYVNLRLNAHYSFCKNYRAEFGIGMSHFSDGAAKIPNLGINLPELNAGITYRISENPKINYTDTSLTHKEKSKFEIVCFAGGFKAQVIPPSGKNFCAFTFSTSVDWLTSRKNRFLFGVETGYNGGNILRTDRSVVITKNSQLLQEGIKIGYALRIGSLELPLEFGRYVHTLCKETTGNYFHRIGLRYYLKNNLLVNFTLKTHWAVADYWECGIGYVFKKK